MFDYKYMKIAFLFLTYGDILFKTQLMQYIKNHNMYIHPKYNDEVSDELKKYIIKNQINTQWGSISLVEASINLLQTAYENNDNEYFVLLSSDVWPVQSIDKLEKYLEKNKLSIFDKQESINEYKTSQWWVLNKQDAKIILNTKDKYLDYFKNNIKFRDAAYDEMYFMYVLMKEHDNYKYNNNMFCFVNWLKNTHQKHPAYFNKMTEKDMNNIQNNNSFFIRKCLPSFTDDIIKPKTNLYIIYIGTETNQEKLLKIKNKDFIIITSLELNKLNKTLLRNCIQCHTIIWRFYYESVLDMCINYNILNQWKNILITTEKFIFDDVSFEKPKHSIGELHRNFVFKNDKLKKYINKKMFIYAKDKYNNMGLVFKQSYLA